VWTRCHIATISGLAVVPEPAETVPNDTTILGLGAAGKRRAASLMAMGAGLLYAMPPSWNVRAPWHSCSTLHTDVGMFKIDKLLFDVEVKSQCRFAS
jgi:hypothetical protein